MLRLVKSVLFSSVSVPGSRTGPSICMPRTRREPQHAVIAACAFESSVSLAGGVDVKVEVEETFVAVNGFEIESIEAPKPKAGKRKRASQKQATADVDLEPSTSKECPIGRLSPLALGPPAGQMYVGAHVSMASGIERAVVNAAAIGARAFALDVRSKRRWDCPPLTVQGAQAFRDACLQFGYSTEHIIPHGSYLINLASVDDEVASKSMAGLLDELRRCEMLGIRMYNIHPGTTCGQGSEEEGLERISRHINAAHEVTKDVVIVLENTAGGGSTLGRTFQQLRRVMQELAGIIDGVSDKARIGVCLDTCHLYAAGYDLASSYDCYMAVMKEFEEVIGFHYLRAMHLNDSKAPIGSRKDRHENIGKGCIGPACFQWIMNDPRLQGLPLIMETPVQDKPPNIDYKKSLAEGNVYFKEGEKAETVGTDERDINLLYSFVSGAQGDPPVAFT